MRRSLYWPIVGATLTPVSVAGITLSARRARSDREAVAAETDLLAVASPLPRFSADAVDTLPDPARRYLRHAVADGTPLAPSGRLWMAGTLRPAPGARAVALTATETLAPRRGFVWTARARRWGLPVRVRDAYIAGEGSLRVEALGFVPVVQQGGPDVTRSARGRLVAEAVWCPTALVHPDVTWEAVDADRARYTIPVDGASVSVTVHVGPDGALREVTLDRWGDVDGPWRPVPYGFRVDEELTFDGVTIPTRLLGGWHYGTDRFDAAAASSFTVRRAEWACPRPTEVTGAPATNGAVAGTPRAEALQ